MSRPGHRLDSPLPHPDHFDPTKFGPDGEPLQKGGRFSKLRPEDVDQVLYLDKLAQAATGDLAEFLEARGYVGKTQQAAVLHNLRNGWRPKR